MLAVTFPAVWDSRGDFRDAFHSQICCRFGAGIFQVKEVLVPSEIHLGGFGCCSNVRVVVYVIGDRVDKETTA